MKLRPIKQISLPRPISDHKPLLLECGDWDTTHSYFKFVHMWLQQEGFINMINEWQQGYSVGGSPDYILSQKLKNLKDISKWNKEVFSKLDMRRNKALEWLKFSEQITEGRTPTLDERQIFELES